MDLAEFAGYMVEHRKLADAEEALYEALTDPGDVSLVYLYGPSGVGKTTLLGGLRRRLALEAMARMATDPAHLPYLFATATSPESGPFSWRELYLALLKNANEQGLDWKVAGDRWHSRPGAPDLRRVLVNIAGPEGRSIPVFMIDEAPHIGDAGSGRVLLDRTDILKGLAIDTGAKIVLAGTYRLKAFSDLSDQGSRRTAEVHFGRYLPDEEGTEDFRAIAEYMIGLLPMRVAPSDALFSDLYRGSLGCIGNLRNWLLRAAIRAQRAGSKSLTREHLRRTRKTRTQLQKMAKAIYDGELTLEADEDDLSAVESYLRLPGSAPIREVEAKLAQSAIYRTRPGTRKPHRLETGSGAARG